MSSFDGVVYRGQLKVTDEGWKLLEKGDGKTEGKRALGVWQNEAKTAIV